MKLKHKFLLPSIFQAAITLCLILYLAIAGSGVLSALKSNTAYLNQAIDLVYSITNNTDRFFLNELNQEEFEKQIEKAIRAMTANESIQTTAITEEMKQINELIKQADALNAENQDIIEKIMALTEHSIAQSTNYITATATNLMDPQKKDQVSMLERAVIIGANTNTAANLRIQTKVFQLLRDINTKDELLSFLDQGIENATKDMESLKNTPFAQLPVAALQANKEIKTLTLGYADNVDASNALRDTIQIKTEKMLAELNRISEASIDNTFDDVYGLGVFLLVTLLVIALALFGFGLFMARIISNPLMQLRNLVTAVVTSGDLSRRLDRLQKDEVGQTISAFNSLIGSFQQAINEVSEVMEAVADGDFTMTVKSSQKGDLDRLKDSINNSIRLLGKTIAQVGSTSEQVDIGAQQLSQSAQALASGATEQAASLEQISSTTGLIDSQTRANSNNADQAKQLSNQTLTIVENGNRKMDAMLASMTKINETSSNVSKVIKVIDEIAFQTNLLALNAAVEAARAGKYGKGFAVVAEEVRNLASRSAEAAKNTTELINTSISEVESGVTNSRQTAEALAEIIRSVEKINDLVEDIAEASREQTIGIDEVNKGLTQINSVVQQNSSISEETASSSDELSAQATALRKLISKFRFHHLEVDTYSMDSDGHDKTGYYLEDQS